MKIMAWMTSTFLGSITLKIPDRNAPKRVKYQHETKKMDGMKPWGQCNPRGARVNQADSNGSVKGKYNLGKG